MNTGHEMDTGKKMNTGLSVEEEQISKTVITKEEHDSKTAPNGMPVYDINEPWVQ